MGRDVNNADTDNYDYSYLGTNPFFPIKKECNDAIEKLNIEYKECQLEVDDKTADEICKIVDSDKCQKYFNIKVVDIPECKDSIEDAVISIDNLRKLAYSELKAECIKDENNKYCPLNSKETQKIITPEMSEEQQKQAYEKAKEETCKSQKCIDGYLSFFSELIDITKEYADALSKYGNISKEEVDDMKNTFKKDKRTSELIDYLKSDQCKSKIIYSSSAETVIKNMNLYLGLSLITVLYFLF